MKEKRNCPTVWSQNPVPESPLASFEKNGFYLLKNVCNLDVLRDLKVVASAPKIEKGSVAIFERDGLSLRSIFNVSSTHLKALKHVLKQEAEQFVRDILGSPVFLYQNHINLKEGLGRGDQFDWHSDFSYWYWLDGMPKPRAVSVVIPLDPHSPDNGGLQILAGSHKYVHCASWSAHKEWSDKNMLHDGRDNCPGISRPSEYPETFDIYEANLSVGDALVMDANALHMSGVNNSPNRRATLFLILASTELEFESPFSGQKERPHYISNKLKEPFFSNISK